MSDAVRQTYKDQPHILAQLERLGSVDKAALLAQLSAVDIQRASAILANALQPQPPISISPLPPASIATPANPSAGNWRQIGLKAIAEGHVAVILLAGGQGTRLGSSDPKGCYDINLPSHKSLFQLQAERIVKLQQIASKLAGKNVSIPWYIMTSGPTRSATETFFIKKNYFGLNKQNVVFFDQGVLPAFTKDGKLFLESKSSISVAPDGNGGIYAALRTNGIITDLKQKHIKYLHVYCVDNCLVKVADPLFIGYCIDKKADCAVKAVPKSNPTEPVGIICLKNNKPAVVEYSEIDASLAAQTNADGSLVYNAANIANHFFTTEFLDHIESIESKLAYHIAHKKIKHYDPSSEEIISPTSPNGVKLELFIFDVLPYAKSFAVFQVPRNDEFSPLKNAPGSKDGDSPETSRNDIMAQHVRFVEAAGGKVAETVGSAVPVFEISPLVSYNGEDLELCQGLVIPTPKLISSINDLQALISS